MKRIDQGKGALKPWNLTFYIWPLWVLFLYDHKIFVFILCYWSLSCAIIYIESLRGRTNAVKPVYKGHLKEPENVPFISPLNTDSDYMHYLVNGKHETVLYLLSTGSL